MQNAGVLDALLPKTRQKILAILLTRPERAWYASELARQIGVAPSSLQRELQSLTKAGILKSRKAGRMAHYQADADCLVFSDLRGLLLKTAGLVDVLADTLRPLTRKIRVAFVYGSIAHGTDQDDSDIDLMVVGAISPIELSTTLRRARDMLSREINPTVLTAAEFDRKRESKDHFLTQVLAKPRLFVLGDKDDLGRTIGC